MTRLTRRRFLTISAAVTALPLQAGTAPTARWQGVALGAPASLRIEGMDEASAAPVFAGIEAELDRLEMIFSLYRPDSQISILNRAGRLDAPAPELLEVLSLSQALHGASGGAFDPTVQPLWVALAQGRDAAGLRAARQVVGWSGLRFDADRVAFDRPGMALTLNGIAQGAITDRIAALLRGHGLDDVLIDMGEIAALGGHGDGADWTVGITDPQGAILRRMTLRDRALATSAPMGTELGDGLGHILGPRGETPRAGVVTVSADDAALADGLSTALCLMAPDQAAAALARFPGARLEYRA
ncbi:thiamine biosynthesis lipoprotein [Cribrihabitans marinus]|uniref:FAD:protein FMN transferase n=1 Tax=Cribrihabitans marinus TaxID=1227549 RepID=A0A1H7DNF3_9RHOB|nr:FAD:protein FMN transferase [Cribrihabitans marinus]SEK03098.1 thiamine biosynthesis lipoprotein [Cribrihabitans marinus]